MQFITTIPMLTTEIENWARHCSIESRGSWFQINVGGSGKDYNNMTRINIALGKGISFSPKSDKSVSTILSMIVEHVIMLCHNFIPSLFSKNVTSNCKHKK